MDEVDLINQEKLTRIQGVLKPPQDPILISESDWIGFEAETGLEFPLIFKKFMGIYGCGSINREIRIFAPMCKVTEKDTMHIENIEYSRLDQESRTYVKVNTPILYPAKDGVYMWGNDTIGNVFAWRFDKVNSINDSVSFNDWKIISSETSFLDIILDSIYGNKYDGVTPETAEYVPWYYR